MAEELGLDGVVVNEHHQNAYGLMPSPNLIAAALTRETSRVKICVLGNALPCTTRPRSVAEEMAMLDVMSDGRLIAGLVVGGGPEYYSTNVNPTEARPRFARRSTSSSRLGRAPAPSPSTASTTSCHT